MTFRPCASCRPDFAMSCVQHGCALQAPDNLSRQISDRDRTKATGVGAPAALLDVRPIGHVVLNQVLSDEHKNEGEPCNNQQRRGMQS